MQNTRRRTGRLGGRRRRRRHRRRRRRHPVSRIRRVRRDHVFRVVGRLVICFGGEKK